VSSQYRGPSSEQPNPNPGTNPDSNAKANASTHASGNNSASTSERWGPWQLVHDEDTQPYRAVSKPASTPAQPAQGHNESSDNVNNDYAQFTHREHVTSPLPAYPPAPVYPPAYNAPIAPAAGYQPTQGQQGQEQNSALSQPSYPAYPGQPGQQGYQHPAYAYPAQPYPGYPAYPTYPAYPGYGYGAAPAYPYPYWQPMPGQLYAPSPYQPPQRDGYQLAMSIVALIGSGLAVLAGLACAFFTLLVATVSTGTPIAPDQLFSSVLTLLAFACAGIIGGSFSLYHSIRALLRKRSASFTLPTFWIFAVLYAVVIAVGYGLKINKMAVSHAPLTALLIFLAAIFPALALLAIADRRMRNPQWPTTWRRFTISLTSGATLSIALALALELGLIILLARGQNATNMTECINNPDLPVCQQNPAVYGFIIVVAAVIAPLVEETVKPLAVALYIGRVSSAAEAFIMGMAAGIGFDLIETVGYIGEGYHDWVNVALERTGTGLLHGFGAAMVALGWYYLIHAKNKRFLKAFGFWLYAVLQHAIWNGSATLVLLPAPIGPTLNNWNLNLGFTTLPFPEILNIVEAILFFIFFLYMTGRLKQTNIPPTSTTQQQPAPPREPQFAARSY